MTLADVVTSPNPVTVKSPLVIQFKVLDAKGKKFFTFPFSNNSLTEKKIQFIKKEEENQNG